MHGQCAPALMRPHVLNTSLAFCFPHLQEDGALDAVLDSQL